MNAQRINELARLLQCLEACGTNTSANTGANESAGLVNTAGNNSDSNPASAVVGKFCVVRASAAGVHAGIVTAVDGDNVILKDSRRLWSYTCAKEGSIGALSGVAMYGLKSGKLDVELPFIVVRGWCELIPTTAAAEKTIRAL